MWCSSLSLYKSLQILIPNIPIYTKSFLLKLYVTRTVCKVFSDKHTCFGLYFQISPNTWLCTNKNIFMYWIEINICVTCIISLYTHKFVLNRNKHMRYLCISVYTYKLPHIMDTFAVCHMLWKSKSVTLTNDLEISRNMVNNSIATCVF